LKVVPFGMIVVWLGTFLDAPLHYLSLPFSVHFGSAHSLSIEKVCNADCSAPADLTTVTTSPDLHCTTANKVHSTLINSHA
jgi:hypothetical protein